MRSLWSMFYDKEKLPITKPPWSEIITYDLNDNKISWRAPIGDYPELKNEPPNRSDDFTGVWQPPLIVFYMLLVLLINMSEVLILRMEVLDGNMRC